MKCLTTLFEKFQFLLKDFNLFVLFMKIKNYKKPNSVKTV